jgi:hypothetical protein
LRLWFGLNRTLAHYSASKIIRWMRKYEDCLPITLDVDYIVKSTKFIEKQKKLRYSERSYDRFSDFSSKVGQKQ